MKLMIQIPCLNEAATLPTTLAALPNAVPGFDEVEVLVVDDGSADGTAEVALAHGVDHVVRLRANRGLAAAFRAGIDASLKLGADVIVNTDADNQYNGDDVARLVAPILAGQADVVIGDRRGASVEAFSPGKRALQRVGSWVVRRASGADVPDAASGFRAYSREGALEAAVVSEFSYTLETVIRAGRTRGAVAAVPVRTNLVHRDSRLFGSTWEYVKRSAGTIMRVFTMYAPLHVFLTLAALFAAAGLALAARFVYLYATTEGPTGHVQSLVVGGVCLVMAVQLAAIGFLADLLRVNRVIAERTEKRVRSLEFALGIPPEGLVTDRPGERLAAGAREARGRDRP